MLNLKQAYLDIISGERKGLSANAGRFFLKVLSFLYCRAVWLRNAFFDWFGPRKKYRCKIVSIGNITWGGTGKTSLAVLLARWLAGKKKTCVLTRGYGEDEVFLLKEFLAEEDVKIIAAKNKRRALDKIESFYDVIIIDDGFQTRNIYRDLDIVMINCMQGFGNGWVIPAGNLREPLSGLKRAGMFVLNYYTQGSGDLRGIVRKYNSCAEIFTARYQPVEFLSLDSRHYPLSFLQGKDVLCVSAIAWPEGFWQVLAAAGVNIKAKLAFVDHKQFSLKDIEKIKTKAEQSGSHAVVITHKDKSRFLNLNLGIDVFILEAGLSVENEDKFKKEIYALLFGKDNK